MIICKNCNAQLDDSERVCRYCGAPVVPAADTPFYVPPAPMDPALGAAGYSGLVDSEEVIAALKKNRRVTNIITVVFDLLPIAGFLIYGLVSDKMDVGKAAVYGLIVTAIFILISVISAIRHRLAKPFEGTVTDKKVSRQVTHTANDSTRSRTKYTVRIDCDDGKRRKKEVNLSVYDYLQIGDRVRYLPKFPQPFEKYDKRPDGAVLCMFCSRMNPLNNTACEFCHKPLIR